ncbi:Macrophage-capping protein [Bagarius yarrelli]|uniref:Macrophage-capping protein n=1 Tax=Bagarius yarrelli TaxID=175774 RepID=A0A556V8L9_BAGYA|nr:Macrophage-capping protein [Bagarius yarrelli]
MLSFQAAPNQFGPEVRQVGLHCWRVEKLKAVPLAASEIGAFYNGDSYLVLQNRGDDGVDLHMWIGEKSSRDEQVACAVLATQLDNFLGGDPVQHRQVQGYESPEFMSLFPRGISYKTIVSWVGSQANIFEKQKVGEIAALIRDTERHGKAQITQIQEGEETPEMLKVSDATGSMKLTKVSEKSLFAKDLLVRDDCFILDNGANGKIFIWKELNPVANVEGQSHSIGAVRWNLPEETVQVHSSAPSNPFKNSKGTSSHSQQRHHQQSLKDLRSLQECIYFLNNWKLQVAQVCKEGSECASGVSDRHEDPRTEHSLEESRKLILQWADELKSIDKVSKESPWLQERFKCSVDNEQKKEEHGDAVQERVMEWAKELQSVSEKCGMLGDELVQMLRLLGLRKKRLVSLMPLLEFITWSLLTNDSKDVVSQLWLLAKQRSWEAVDVTLDPLTAHPWLLLSDDQKRVQEGLEEADPPYSPQRFDSWPCVLGWTGYLKGRSYWEVDIANNGYWRVGVTTASSKRNGRFPMKPSKGYWTLWRSTRQFYACTDPETSLPVMLVPRKMGIYIDYEEGQISFYNVENKSHIYTFTGHFRGKLYPFFAPLDGRTVMTISSPGRKNKS